MDDFLKKIERFIPETPGEGIDWEGLAPLLSAAGFSALENTPQNPVFHREGDALTHTKLVCGELTRMAAFRSLPSVQKTELFLAALLHDIGKVRTTRIENGVPAAPHHASAGSLAAGEFLWKECGICGTEENMNIRETVCALIRWHMRPPRLFKREDPLLTGRVIASEGELAKGFSWHLLSILSEADIRGRIAEDTEESLSQIRLSRILTEEAGFLYGPYPFADPFTKHAYLSGRNVHPDQVLFDDTWGEVILLSGLPGTGKDTLIRESMPDLPVISLDAVRASLRIKPGDDQGLVLQTAQEQAREYLRARQPFIWNATNVIKETRQNLCGLFERYGAKTRIIYLETDWEQRRIRNLERQDPVPEEAVAKMLGKTVLPTPEEAHTVEWISV